MINVRQRDQFERQLCFFTFYEGLVSAVDQWHERVVNISYKRCRFATFTRLRTATMLAHTL